VKIYSHESRSRLAKKDKQPPGDSSSYGEAGQAAQGGQGDLDRASQPAGSGFRQSHAGRVLNLKIKQNSFSKEIFPPTTH
jgi:hypothetical protein